MARVAKKTEPASLDLAVDKKSPKGKSPIKISKPKAAKTQSDGVLPDSDAIDSEEINAEAVEEAKKALAAGKLDTPEAIKRAAKEMLDSGL